MERRARPDRPDGRGTTLGGWARTLGHGRTAGADRGRRLPGLMIRRVQAGNEHLPRACPTGAIFAASSARCGQGECARAVVLPCRVNVRRIDRRSATGAPSSARCVTTASGRDGAGLREGVSPPVDPVRPSDELRAGQVRVRELQTRGERTHGFGATPATCGWAGPSPALRAGGYGLPPPRRADPRLAPYGGRQARGGGWPPACGIVCRAGDEPERETAMSAPEPAHIRPAGGKAAAGGPECRGTSSPAGSGGAATLALP